MKTQMNILKEWKCSLKKEYKYFPDREENIQPQEQQEQKSTTI